MKQKTNHQADYHKPLFDKLMSGKFVETFANLLYGESAKAGTIVYTQAIDKVREQHPKSPGPTHKKWFENDAVVIFVPQQRTDYKAEPYLRPCSVAIEIKASVDDLVNDKKMEQYMGAIPFFFLAVPSVLIIPAIQRIEKIPAFRNRIGLIDIDNGKIVIMPQEDENYDKDRNDKLLGAMNINPKRFSNTDQGYMVRPVSIDAWTPPLFTHYDGRQINTDYLKLFKDLDRIR